MENDRHADVKKAAVCNGLGGIGPSASAAIPQLLDILAKPDNPLYESAVCAIGQIGATAHVAVPVLIDTLEKLDDPAKVRAIERALQGIRTEPEPAPTGNKPPENTPVLRR